MTDTASERIPLPELLVRGCFPNQLHLFRPEALVGHSIDPQNPTLPKGAQTLDVLKVLRSDPDQIELGSAILIPTVLAEVFDLPSAQQREMIIRDLDPDEARLVVDRSSLPAQEHTRLLMLI